MRDERKLALLLFAVVALVWAPSLWNGFVWDDINNLVRSDRLRHWSSLIEVFRHDAMWSANRPQPAIGTYRPLALATFVVDYQLFGLWAAGFHLTSVLWHATTAVVVFLLFARWAPVGPAFGLALLWAVHPTAAEAVAWINGRSEILALLFGAGALRVVSAPRIGPGRLAAAGALLLLAMLGKETGAIFVPLAVWLAGESTGIAGPGRPPWRRVHWPIAVVAAAAVGVYAAARAAALTGGVAPGLGGSVGAFRVLPAVWLRALQATVFPLDRSIGSLHRWLRDLPVFEIAGYTAAAVALFGLGAVLWRRGRRLPLVGLAWWAASLIPVALIAVRDWPGFNRWLYIGMPGLLLALYAGAFAGRALRPRTGAALLAAALIPALVQTQRAIPVWRDGKTLYLTMVEEHPDEPFGYVGLGFWLLRTGRPADALPVLDRALELGSTREVVYLYRGMARAELGDCAAGAREARDHVAPADVPPWFLISVADCFARQGETEKARRLLAACADENETCAEGERRFAADPP